MASSTKALLVALSGSDCSIEDRNEEDEIESEYKLKLKEMKLMKLKLKAKKQNNFWNNA